MQLFAPVQADQQRPASSNNDSDAANIITLDKDIALLLGLGFQLTDKLLAAN